MPFVLKAGDVNLIWSNLISVYSKDYRADIRFLFYGKVKEAWDVGEKVKKNEKVDQEMKLQPARTNIRRWRSVVSLLDSIIFHF